MFKLFFYPAFRIHPFGIPHSGRAQRWPRAGLATFFLPIREPKRTYANLSEHCSHPIARSGT